MTSRVAVVTGAARGIGAATVLALAADGWSVMAVDRAADDPALPYPMAGPGDLTDLLRRAAEAADRARALATDARDAGARAEVAGAAERVRARAADARDAGARAEVAGAAERVRARAADARDAGAGAEVAGAADRVCAIVADVRDPDALAAAVAEAESRWGGLDAAIAAAGVIAGGVPLWELPPARQQAVLDVNLGGVLSLARAAVPALLRRPAPRSGRFLAVASAAASRGLPMLAAYCAAKAGVTGLVRALAAELADSGVTANAVSPGSVATAMLDETARLYGLPGPEAFATQQPAGRLLDPAEVAAVLAFLASPASSGMTGAIVPVDGGLAL